MTPAKGVLCRLTTSLAREFAERGIAVNAVAPGMIYTDMTAETLKVTRSKIPRAHTLETNCRRQGNRRCCGLPGLTASKLHDRHDGQREWWVADAVIRAW